LKRAEEVIETLKAYDLAGSLRAAAALAGCDHKTVAHWVRQRELAGGMPAAERHKPAVGDFAGRIDELVERYRRPGQLPARPSHRRQRGDAPHLTLLTSPDGGEIRGHQWGDLMPPVGRSDGRTWGDTDGH
jgi:hypothetical protein